MLLDFTLSLSLSLSLFHPFSFSSIGFWSKYFSNVPLLEAIIKETLEDFGKIYKYFGSYNI
jgi:hypothetical protein